MSKIKLTGHASGSGVLTIAAPNTDTDRTITLPDVTGTLLDSGSDLPAANLTGSVAAARIASNTIDSAHITAGAIDDAHLATGISASKLTGALPAISGANLTGVGVAGITSSADATAMTITSDEKIGIGTTTPPERLSIHEPSTATGTYFPVAITGANYVTGYGVGISFKTENTSPTQKAKAAIIAEGTGEGYNKTSLHIAMSNTSDTTTEVALANSVIEFTMDGKGRSLFTAASWFTAEGSGTPSFNQSHNCSSIESMGSNGYYRVHWDTNLTTSTYAIVNTSHKDAYEDQQLYNITRTGESARYVYVQDSAGGIDIADFSSIIFGD